MCLILSFGVHRSVKGATFGAGCATLFVQVAGWPECLWKFSQCDGFVSRTICIGRIGSTRE